MTDTTSSAPAGLAGAAAGVLVAAAILGLALALPERAPDGRSLPLSFLFGAAFGVVLQRARLCFFCVTRDFLDKRDPRGLIGIVAALAVGLIGYHLVFGAWLPVPNAPRLPPDAHIGPVSWVLALGAFAFGLGMAVSGSCISAHMYRLGEGALASVVALVGAAFGFGLGFASWNTLYLGAIQEAPVLWLPHRLGYGGSLAVQLGALAAIAAWLLRHPWPVEPRAGSPLSAIFRRRWPAHIGGILVGAIAVLAYFRVGPLGVTAELGSLARTGADGLGLLPGRLEGLDSFAGCATAVKEAVLSRNGVFVLGLVLGSLAAALTAGDFRPRRPSGAELARALGGGLLLGWGAMVALGCTIGVVLSGTMAGAVSGWVFMPFCLAGLWLGWRGRQRLGLD
jgi:uncharacterized membrane protein YedE/YeeE